MSHPRFRSVVLLIVMVAMGLAGCGGAPSSQTSSATAPAGPTAAKPTSAASSSAATINGVTLPPDAAPADQQVLLLSHSITADFTTLDWFEAVYKRAATGVLLSEPLLRLNKEFELVPAAATEWSVDQSGLIWTFKLDPNLIWSDDTPLTADDFVATFRYAADPKHAWDFSWVFNKVIKNWDAVVAGTQPLEALGVKAVDRYTLQFETEAPAPYLPAMLVFSSPFQKRALETHGGLYNSDPATSVSSGPFVLKEWRKGERLVFEANPKYGGTNKPYIQKIINIAIAPSTSFTAYQAGQIDFVSGAFLSPADNQVILDHPQLRNELHQHYGDFRTDYLFFDTANPPFNNPKVRQAFSHVIDRDALINTIIKPNQGIPAYSFMMPGFPAAASEELKHIQNYDPDKARQLLAEAGYPGGQGFPKITLWLRDEPPVRQAVGQAIAASLRQHLGIDVDVSNKETKTFMDALRAKPTQIQFGMVSYGLDYLDPRNLLSVWRTSGRHNWSNPQFDALIDTAASFDGDPEERIRMFQEAEKLLVTEAAGVFIYHRMVSDLYKPYLKGSELEPDENGYAAVHWPGFSNLSTLLGSVYISKDVANFHREIP